MGVSFHMRRSVIMTKEWLEFLGAATLASQEALSYLKERSRSAEAHRWEVLIHFTPYGSGGEPTPPLNSAATSVCCCRGQEEISHRILNIQPHSSEENHSASLLRLHRGAESVETQLHKHGAGSCSPGNTSPVSPVFCF